MTKEEFTNRYCERSGITREFYNEHFVSLLCRCEDSSCRGWAAVSNNELMIKTHKELYYE